jgi:hypothetical protein
MIKRGTEVTRSTEIRTLVSDVAQVLRAIADDRGVEIDVDDEWPDAVVDARVKDVLLELTVNGITQSDSGKPRRFVSVESVPVERPELVGIAIHDNAIVCREPNPSLQTATKRLEAVGGSMQTDSREGVGNTMVVVVPRMSG